MRKRRLRMWPKLVLVLLLGAAAYWAAQWYQRRMLYAPDPSMAATPAKIGLPFESETIPSAGVDIHGWYVPASTAGRPVILFLHGRAGNLGHCLQKIRFFNDLGLNVFAVDYRGYGQSTGKPNEIGLQYDAVSAYFHLTSARGIPANQIFVYGESLGAAVAVDLAARVQLAGLILEAPFTSAVDLLDAAHPGIPWNLLLRDRFDSLQKIPHIATPVLLIHSSDDEQVPFRHAQRMFAAAREPKKLVKIHGTHDQALLNSFDSFHDEVTSFIEAHATRQDGQPGPTR